MLSYSFYVFKILVGFGLDFEFGLGLMLDLGVSRVWVRFRVGVRARIVIFLFLRIGNVKAASAFLKIIEHVLVGYRVFMKVLCSYWLILFLYIFFCFISLGVEIRFLAILLVVPLIFGRLYFTGNFYLVFY